MSEESSLRRHCLSRPERGDGAHQVVTGRRAFQAEGSADLRDRGLEWACSRNSRKASCGRVEWAGVREASDAFRKAMGRGWSGWTFPLMGNSWSVLCRRVRSSDLDHRGTTLVVMLRRLEQDDPWGSYFSTSGGREECLDSAAAAK